MGSGRSELSEERWRNKGVAFLHVAGLLVTADFHAEFNRSQPNPVFDDGFREYRKTAAGNQFGGILTRRHQTAGAKRQGTPGRGGRAFRALRREVKEQRGGLRSSTWPACYARPALILNLVRHLADAIAITKKSHHARLVKLARPLNPPTVLRLGEKAFGPGR